MSKKEDKKLHHTTISSSSHTTERLWIIRQRLGLKTGESRRGGRMKSRAHNNDEIINMALDAFEEKLDRESK